MSTSATNDQKGKSTDPPYVPLTKDQEVSTHPALKTGTIKQLKPPGPDSNYQDWSWVMEVHFENTDVWYVIAAAGDVVKAQPNWVRDNKAVVGAIVKTIHPANIRNVCHLKNDARALWAALKCAHQDSSTRGLMYWLQKLTSARMTGEDLETHLAEMAKSFDCLKALITPDAPLTPNDIYATCILTSLPSDWLLCVSSMTNKTRVDPSKLLDALRAEDLRRKTRSKDSSTLQSVTTAKTGQPDKTKPKANNSTPRHCTFCDIDGHDLNRCRNVAGIIANHKQSQSGGKKQPEVKSGPSIPVTKANRVLAVSLGNLQANDDEDSDFSGSLVEVTAGCPGSHSLRPINVFPGSSTPGYPSSASFQLAADGLHPRPRGHTSTALGG
ncbi:hypothetical protein PCANC_14214 [Puccinia coronata f. sp. avenae]|uniref:Uncharacterized protein n=1 Tax=Puccinia coronata f. sp. avenae TaxID=200324 RepID=A0A2N5SYK8_9BASI|nr:hypothetical protein PCANC_14214 [Puccinia coronata f. sp. avenae]